MNGTFRFDPTPRRDRRDPDQSKHLRGTGQLQYSLLVVVGVALERITCTRTKQDLALLWAGATLQMSRAYNTHSVFSHIEA